MPPELIYWYIHTKCLFCFKFCSTNFKKMKKIKEPITELRSAECASFRPQCFGSSVLALVVVSNLKFVSHRVGKIKKVSIKLTFLICGEKDLALRPAPSSLDSRTCSALLGFKSFSSVHINKKSWHKASSFCLRRKGLEPSWNYFH